MNNDLNSNDVGLNVSPEINSNSVPSSSPDQTPVIQVNNVPDINHQSNPIYPNEVVSSSSSNQPINNKKKLFIICGGALLLIIIIILLVIFLGGNKGKNKGNTLTDIEYQDCVNTYGLEINKQVTSYYAQNSKIPSFDDIKGKLPKSDVTCEKNTISRYGIVESSNCHIKGYKYNKNIIYLSDNIDEFSFLYLNNENSNTDNNNVEVPTTNIPENVTLDNALDAANTLQDMVNEKQQDEDYQYVMNDLEEENIH